MKALFLDTETGGLDCFKCALTSVSVILFEMTSKGMTTLETFNVLINPPRHLLVEDRALEVQGITLEDLGAPERVGEKYALELFQVWLEEIRAKYEVTDTLPIFAHNAPFDKGFVCEWFYRNTYVKGNKLLSAYTSRHSPWFCTIQLANLLTYTGKIKRPEEGYSLNSLAKHFKLKEREASDTHNSMEDCYIGAELASVLFKKGKLF